MKQDDYIMNNIFVCLNAEAENNTETIITKPMAT
jgi:hypothetical protein